MTPGPHIFILTSSFFIQISHFFPCLFDNSAFTGKITNMINKIDVCDPTILTFTTAIIRGMYSVM